MAADSGDPRFELKLQTTVPLAGIAVHIAASIGVDVGTSL